MARRDFEDLTVLVEGDHSMLSLDRDVICLTGGDTDLAEDSMIVLEKEEHAAGVEQDGLFLAFVILQRELVPPLDVKDLAGIVGRTRPQQLVAPRLLDLLQRLHGSPFWQPP